MPSIALLSNPDAGSGDSVDLPGKLRSMGADVEEFEVGQFDEAARSGADRVVVAGGDGSIAPSARAAADAGIPLGVIPSGTANDFARAHGLPLVIDDACRLAVEGDRTMAIDIAAMNDRPFLNVVGLGLHTASAKTAHGLKKRLGPFAYGVGAIKTAFTAPSMSCTVLCDGDEWFSGEIWQLTVACSGAFGGGARIDADPADGGLKVVVIEARLRLRLPRHAYGLRAGGVEGQEGVRSVWAREIALETRRGLSYSVDGEIVEADAPTFSVDPSAVELVVG